MDKLKVIVVDSDVENCNALANDLNCDKLEVVATAYSGVECLEKLEHIDVDIVLTELLLQAMDGYMLINKINNINSAKKPKIFAMSNLKAEAYVTNAIKMGIMYYFIKPLDNKIVQNTIIATYDRQSIWESIKDNNDPLYSVPNKVETIKNTTALNSVMEEKIAKIFISVGIPAHIKGYQYLREAIKEVVDDPSLINNITKKLYPNVAKVFDTSPSKVERAIRHAIEVAWNRGKIENINKIFGFKVYNVNDKPTNGEFIALVADKLMVDSIAG